MMNSEGTGDGVDPRQKTWDEFVRKTNKLIESGELDEQEVKCKLDLGRELAEAREAVLNGAEDWVERFKIGIRYRRGHPMSTQGKNGLTQWIEQTPDDALGALKALWKQEDSTIDARVRAFSDWLPQDPMIHGREGTRIRTISTLLMGLGAEDHPPFAPQTFKEAYRQTGYAQPERNADEAELYEHALGFLDQFLKEAQARGARLRHRLDAQSIVWLWRKPPDHLPQLGLPFPECPNGVDTENNQDGWDEFVRRANNELIKSGNLDKWENNYKRELARDLEKAREELFADTDKWVSLVDRGLKSNLIYFANRLNFREWMINSGNAARKALMAIWAKESLSVDQRIRDFCKEFPRDIIGGGAGTRMNLASVLLMGVDVERFPPFRITVFKKVCMLTGYNPPAGDANEAELYDHFLSFLDKFIEKSRAHKVNLKHRLDAQGVVWQLQNHLPKLGAHPVEPKSLNALSDELLLPPDFLKEISSLLDDKRQVIFQGPPGTGKTYLAQELAKYLADSESGERITPVQFHPSYSYEDFVRGFRPTLIERQAGFKLQDGPLLRAAEKARDEPGSKHFLIIDEINRGNLAKLFGELYFLLEYRDEPIHMQYQEDDEEDFSLPENLYIIGTMNTADRSIALVDSALRRRFHFVEFHPDSEPVKSLLRRWLEKQGLQETLGIVDVIERANELLQDDRHAAIGPSYFMKEALDRKMVERIWKHSIIPYIEECLFGDEDLIKEFNFEKLCTSVAPELLLNNSEEQTDNGADSDAGGVNSATDQLERVPRERENLTNGG